MLLFTEKTFGSDSESKLDVRFVLFHDNGYLIAYQQALTTVLEASILDIV